MTQLQEPAAPDSAQLLQEFATSGNPQAFEQIMRCHTGMVYATALRVTRDAHDAEDAVQAAFLTLAAKARSSERIEAVGPWLRKVVHRLALDIVRSRKRRNHRENTRGEQMLQELEPETAFDAAHADESRIALRAELEQLPASYRLPLILHYFGGLSREEMAKELRIKASTLGVRLHRGRHMLKKRLEKRGIVLSLPLLGMLLGETVRASVGEGAFARTSRAASAVMFAGTAPTIELSAPVIELVRTITFTLTRSKLRVGLVLALSASLFSGGSGLARLLPANWRPALPSLRFDRFLQPLLEQMMPGHRAFAAMSARDATGSTPAPLPIAMPAIEHMPSDLLSRIVASALNSPPPRLEIAPLSTVTVRRSATLSPSPLKQVAAARGQTPAPAVSVTRGHGVRASARASTDASAQVMARSPKTAAIATAFSTPQPVATKAARPAATPPAIAPSGRPKRPVADAPPPGFAGPIRAAVPEDVIISEPLSGPTVTVPLPHDPIVRVPAVVPTTPSQATPRTVQFSPSTAKGTTAQTHYVFTQPWTQQTTYTQYISASNTNDVAQIVSFAGSSGNLGGLSGDGFSANSAVTNFQVVTRDGTGMFRDVKFQTPLASPTILSVAPTAINAARLTLTSGSPASVEIALQSLNSGLYPELPKPHHFIGIWSLDTDEALESTDLLIRYDDLLAARMGLQEQILKLWVSDGKTWTRIMDSTFGRDIDRNLIWGSTTQDVVYFAVSAPEPATLVMLVGASGLLLQRRRRT